MLNIYIFFFQNRVSVSRPTPATALSPACNKFTRTYHRIFNPEWIDAYKFCIIQRNVCKKFKKAPPPNLEKNFKYIYIKNKLFVRE